MIRFRFIIIISCLLQGYMGFGQQASVQGEIRSDSNVLLQGTNIYIDGTGLGTTADSNGIYKLNVPADSTFQIVFSHVGFDTAIFNIELKKNEIHTLNVSLKERITVLREVDIRTKDDRREPSVVTIEPKSAIVIPSAFGDFNAILSTLPGVITTSELTTGYSVRGGNFDENLVYVNGIPIYRPFLAQEGRQEGLSFVNTDLVSEARFYSGGWQPYYGDKLSSVLDVDYKIPSQNRGSISAGLLGGSAHLEGSTKKGRFTYLLGVRHKRAQYLFNTFDINGEYIPTFTDIQSYLQFNLGKKLPERTQVGVLFAYAKNRYQIIPETRETEFGTFNKAIRFLVAFDGQETLDYDTWQSGMTLTHRVNSEMQMKFTVSGVKSYEREYGDLEGGYRLCDVDKNPGSSSFNECVSLIGLGTNFFHARNSLETTLFQADVRSEYAISNSNLIEFGINYSYSDFNDYQEEYQFVDSVGFANVTDQIFRLNTISANEMGGFAQQSLNLGQTGELVYGFRISYRDLNNQWLLAPRIQYSFQPAWKRDIVLKASIGMYQQPPFYREMRNYQGVVDPKVNAQQSLHAIMGFDNNFTWWERPFKWTAEIFYKYLWDVIPYDISNVRLRYYGENIATAYATGLDMRLSGEFIPGTESWFSLGLLSSKEDLENDERGDIRRPTDQHFTIASFFEDHLPSNPTMRVNLGIVYGSGLPFGPPNDFENRNTLNGRSYQRVDIGFTKLFLFKEEKTLESIWLTLEILNLFGNENIISYSWIQELSGNYIAVPNTLTTRYVNLKLTFHFD